MVEQYFVFKIMTAEELPDLDILCDFNVLVFSDIGNALEAECALLDVYAAREMKEELRVRKVKVDGLRDV